MLEKKEEVNILEDMIDIMAQLLNNDGQSQTINPPIPSLNSIENREELVITKEEANELLHILEEIGEELKKKDKLIEDLKEERVVSNKRKEINNRSKGVVEDKNLLDNSYFKDELEKHLVNLDFITVIIVAGQDCCEISGHLCKLYADFLVLVNDSKELIKIPIDKIAAIKANNSDREGRKHNQDDLDDKDTNDDNDLLSKRIEDINSKEDNVAAMVEVKANDEIIDRKKEVNYKEFTEADYNLIQDMRLKVL